MSSTGAGDGQGGHKGPRLSDRLALAAFIGKAVLALGVLAATFAVLLDLFGVVDVFEDGEGESRQANRLPGEYLYLDDERVDAYLGQLRGGLAPTEKRSRSVSRSREASLAAQGVLQVGGSLEEQETVEETVSSRAADRFYVLETTLEARFMGGSNRRFRRVRAHQSGCADIADPTEVEEGQIVRITGARLAAPTYVLALAKVAHAAQFLAPPQRSSGFRVSRGRLSRLATTQQKALRRYVAPFGTDPRLPFRLEIPATQKGRACEVFIPTRYSRLTDAPSLLTGRVTVIGKVVRRLTAEDPTYFDVETAAAYEPAVSEASPAVARTLGFEGIRARDLVNPSATTHYPGLVVLPLAMYK